MLVTCNLHAQWVASIRAGFAANGFDSTSLDDRECIVRWISWQRRLVEMRTRQVHRAAVLSCPSPLQPGLAQLEDAVRTGKPLWPWQSKRIDRQIYEDAMLNDFGILHFHLGANFEGSGYIERTRELLFAVVTRDDFYELGVFDHSSWFELDLLEIMDAAWPALLDPFTIDALSISNTPKSSQDVRLYRENQINSAVTLKSGRIILSPGGGQASDGTSAEAVSSAIHWSKRFHGWERMIREDIQKQVAEKQLEERDYSISLELGADIISASIPETLRWILWRRNQNTP
ncbi:hypothetical protein [Haloferula sargassicola]|uniref:Uncharacterized protein n=1 Tax=Haloferula sargassicola TaxID=490096 RepID=A0ABP9UT91_9BACT